MYSWIVLLHVLSVALFLMVHGVAAATSLQLRQERNIERARALLELTAGTTNILYVALGLILLTGVILAFMGGWWHQGWIWAALVLFIATSVAMSIIAQQDYTPLRKALGLRYFQNGRPQPPVAPSPDTEVFTLLGRTRPGLLVGVGGVGLLLILWLMLLKPF